jgi:hypothetical protein
VIAAACHAGGQGLIPGPSQTYNSCEKTSPFLLPCVRGHIASTAIALYRWIKNITVFQAKVYLHLEAFLKTALSLSHGLVIPRNKRSYKTNEKSDAAAEDGSGGCIP